MRGVVMDHSMYDREKHLQELTEQEDVAQREYQRGYHAGRVEALEEVALRVEAHELVLDRAKSELASLIRRIHATREPEEPSDG